MIRTSFLSSLSVFVPMFLVECIAHVQLVSTDIGDAANTPDSTEIKDGTYTVVGEGDEFHGYISGDGEEWKDLFSQEVKLDDPILVGLAVTSKQSGTLVTAVFDDFTITQNGKETFPAVEPEGEMPITWAGIKLR